MGKRIFDFDDFIQFDKLNSLERNLEYNHQDNYDYDYDNEEILIQDVFELEDELDEIIKGSSNEC